MHGYRRVTRATQNAGIREVVKRQIFWPAIDADIAARGDEARAIPAFREMFRIVPVLEFLLHRRRRFHYGEQEAFGRHSPAPRKETRPIAVTMNSLHPAKQP